MKEYELYTLDNISYLIDEAVELAKNADDEFKKGKLFGYYEVISHLLNQAEAFGILERLPIKVQEFEPESLLNNATS
jgi:hypothetical protein